MAYLLLLLLCVFTYYAPIIFWGLKWSQLIEALSYIGSDAQTLSEITKALGITNQTIEQYIYSKIAICIGIFVLGVIIICFIDEALKKANRTKGGNNKNWN